MRYYRLTFNDTFDKIIAIETIESPQFKNICGIKYSLNFVYSEHAVEQQLKIANAHLRMIVGYENIHDNHT
jgi:hypothetical protein